MFNRLTAALLGIAAAMTASLAAAHPHVVVTVHSEIRYARDGKVAAVRQTWAYDPVYSAFVMRSLDQDGDGQYSDEEFATLAKAQVAAFGEFGFFTTLRVDDRKVTFAEARDYSLQQQAGGVLVLDFTLPLASAAATEDLALEIHDPQFYALFALAKNGDPVRLTGAPRGCSAAATGPEAIDMSQPRSWSKLLYAAVDGSAEAGRQFIHRSVVTCR